MSDISKLDPCEGCGAWCEDGCPREQLVKTIGDMKTKAEEKTSVRLKREEDALKTCGFCYYVDSYSHEEWGYTVRECRLTGHEVGDSLYQGLAIKKGWSKPCEGFVGRKEATCQNCKNYQWRATGYYCAVGEVKKKCKAFSKKG